MVLVFVGNVFQGYLEYSTKAEREVAITEDLLRTKLPKEQKLVDIQLQVFTAGQGQLKVDDFAEARNAKHQLMNGFGTAFKSELFGGPRKDDQSVQTLVLKTLTKGNTLMSIRASRTEKALVSLEFVFDDGSTQIFGNPETIEATTCSEFSFEARKGECLLGFCLKPGIQLEAMTSNGRVSSFFGKEHSGMQ